MQTEAAVFDFPRQPRARSELGVNAALRGMAACEIREFVRGEAQGVTVNPEKFGGSAVLLPGNAAGRWKNL